MRRARSRPRQRPADDTEPEAQRLERTPERFRLTLPAGGAEVAQVFLWVAMGIGGLIGVTALVSAWDRHRQQRCLVSF
ncbi:MAG: hypothetical protein HC897_10560 [Thermoanaerobaculia bacterium]|nr:hypothetical protein [Thermoanaerobaculia bacterium]